MYYKLIKNNKGATALLTVVIVGAAALIMAVSAAFLGLGELDLGYTAQKGAAALFVAEGCAETSLRHLQIIQTYTGGTLNYGGGSCIITISANGQDRAINVTAVLDNYYRSLKLTATVQGRNIILNSWEEVASF